MLGGGIVALPASHVGSLGSSGGHRSASVGHDFTAYGTAQSSHASLVGRPFDRDGIRLADSVTAGPAASSPGAVAGFGAAVGLGGPGADTNKPVVAMAPTATGHGYWLAAADGGVWSYGDAAFYGSLGGVALNKPIVSIASTPDGKGYWLVGADGGVFPFGDAAFYGSLGDVSLNKPIVGMASTPDGKGYWLVGADGGVFSFGDAAFYGSLGGVRLNKPIVGIAAGPHGQGYWLVGSDGGVFPFGDAAFYGSLGGVRLNKPIVGVAPTATGDGYWLVGADGGVFPFGGAAFYGSLAPEPATTAVVAVAADPSSSGYWLATAAAPVEPPAATVSASDVFGPSGTPIGTFVVTCYDLGGTTATGVPTGPQTVAVDPSVIPLGTHLYVQGAGSRIAEDTGGAIIGHRLDIWEPSYSQCADWGVQSQPVWITGG